ncbi:MAG TPA: N-acetylmuramidase domain-containing protein [Anaerolineae bacterium]|nr:N-acetylmuramidase domain-containing protein [Anaerolineae bacterium]
MADPIFVQPKAGSGGVTLRSQALIDPATKVGGLKEGVRLELDLQGTAWHTCRVYVVAQFAALSADGKSFTPLGGSAVNLRSINSANDPGNVVGILNSGQSLELISLLDTWFVGRVYASAQFTDVLAPGQQPTASFGAIFNPADFINAVLTPNSQRTTPANAGFKAVVASKIWNMYGGLIETLSQKINIDSGIAVAVIATESGGQASGAAGRMTIRFENHLFWFRWGKENADVYNQLFQFDATVNWQGHQYRPNTNSPWLNVHANQDSEYAALGVARSLNDSLALSSISMGLVQILGSNFAACGYSSIPAMFDSFSTDPRNQLIGFFNFVVNDSVKVTAMQQKDYATFATRYNGSGQVELYAGLIRDYVDAFNSLIVQPSMDSTPPPTTETAPATTPSQPVKGMANTLKKSS